MKNYAYYNGKVGLIEEMTIPMNDRSTYFGDGVYDAALVCNHQVFSLKEHLDRFYNSCKLLRIDFKMPYEELAELLKTAAASLDEGESFLYWQATRGTAPRDHAFPVDVEPNLLIYCKPKALKGFFRRVKLITAEDTRFLHCNIKTLNLIPNVMVTQQAVEAGCDECVLHRGNRVTECAHSNVSILKNGVLKTAPTDNLILPGITRGHLVSVCKELGIPVEEKAFTVGELMDADEIIVSGTTNHLVGACEIDGKPAGGRVPELLELIQKTYIRRIEAETGIKVL